VIYQQENFEKHEPLTKDIMHRLNDNITDKLSRREIFEAVRKQAKMSLDVIIGGTGHHRRQMSQI